MILPTTIRTSTGLTVNSFHAVSITGAAFVGGTSQMSGFRRIYQTNATTLIDFGGEIGRMNPRLNPPPAAHLNDALDAFDAAGIEPLLVLFGGFPQTDIFSWDPIGAPTTSPLWGTYQGNIHGLMPVNLYVNHADLVDDSADESHVILDDAIVVSPGDEMRVHLATTTVAASASATHIIIDNDLTPVLSQNIRVANDVRIVSNIEANTPVAGQKRITFSTNLSSTPGSGVAVSWDDRRTVDTVDADTPVAGQQTVNFTANLSFVPVTGTPVHWELTDLENPDSYQRIADIHAMYARIYGSTPDAGGLGPFSSDLYSFTNTTGGPLNNGTGLGLLRWMEIANEPFLTQAFKPTGDPGDEGGQISWTNARCAAYTMKVYNTVLAVDPEMNFVLGLVSWDGNKQNVLDGIAAIIAENGGVFPRKMILDIHYYSFNVTQTGGTRPEEPSSAIIPYGYGDDGLLSFLRGVDEMGIPYTIGECGGYDSSQNSGLHAPILSGLTGTSQEQAEKSQGILKVRENIMNLCSKNCVQSVDFHVVDTSSNPDASVVFTTSGWYTSSFVEKLGKQYMNTHMTEIGEYQRPFHWIGSPDGTNFRAVGHKGNETCIMSWDSNSMVSYHKFNKTRTFNLYRDIDWDFAMNAAHAVDIAATDKAPAMRGRNGVGNGATFSAGAIVLPDSVDGLTIQPHVISGLGSNLFLVLEVGNSVDILTLGDDTVLLSTSVSGELVFGGEATGITPGAGVHSIYMKVDEDLSSIAVDDGAPVVKDLTGIVLTSQVRVGGPSEVYHISQKTGYWMAEGDIDSFWATEFV